MTLRYHPVCGLPELPSGLRWRMGPPSARGSVVNEKQRDEFRASVLLAFGLSAAASAAILNEADMSGSDFGGWANPSAVAAGTATISGTFAHLVPIGPTDRSFSADGLIKWAMAPFTNENDGQAPT